MNRKLNMEKISGYGVFFVLIGMLVLFSFIAPHFLEVNNFFNVSRQIWDRVGRDDHCYDHGRN